VPGSTRLRSAHGSLWAVLLHKRQGTSSAAGNDYGWNAQVLVEALSPEGRESRPDELNESLQFGRTAICELIV
jgi:hypothetical protein